MTLAGSSTEISAIQATWPSFIHDVQHAGPLTPRQTNKEQCKEIVSQNQSTGEAISTYTPTEVPSCTRLSPFAAVESSQTEVIIQKRYRATHPPIAWRCSTVFLCIPSGVAWSRPCLLTIVHQIRRHLPRFLHPLVLRDGSGESEPLSLSDDDAGTPKAVDFMAKERIRGQLEKIAS